MVYGLWATIPCYGLSGCKTFPIELMTDPTLSSSAQNVLCAQKTSKGSTNKNEFLPSVNLTKTIHSTLFIP